MDQFMDEKTWNVISNVGFPIFVAGYYLVRIEKKLERIFKILYRMEGPRRDDEDEDDES
jgi:hypothetical protein